MATMIAEVDLTRSSSDERGKWDARVLERMQEYGLRYHEAVDDEGVLEHDEFLCPRCEKWTHMDDGGGNSAVCSRCWVIHNQGDK